MTDIVERLKAESDRLTGRAGLNDRAFSASDNLDAAKTFAAWAVMERKRSLLARDAAAEITRLRALVEEMGKECGPLVEACYEEMHGDVCADEPDDEPVATGLTATGQPYKSPVTFGMIRRARATLAKAKEQS